MEKYRVLFSLGRWRLWCNIENNDINPKGDKGYDNLAHLAIKSCLELIPGIEIKEKPTDIIIERSLNEEKTQWEVIYATDSI